MDMHTGLEKSFTWEIDNFSERKSPLRSTLFSSDGNEWYVLLHPKGDNVDGHLSLYLCVANPTSLPPRWKRRVSLCFVILNQSGKKIHKTAEGSNYFRTEIPGWGFRKAMRLTKLEDKELLENNTLIIDVYMNVTKDFLREYYSGYSIPLKELVNFRGFHVLPSQVIPLSRIFANHPNFAMDIKRTSKKVNTGSIDMLLGLTETLEKPSESFSRNDIDMAYKKWTALTEERGFKLEWLKSKLDEIYSEWKKENATARVQELEESVRNLKTQLSREKFNSTITSAKVLTLERTVAGLKVELDKEKAKSDSKPQILSLEKEVADVKAE